MRVLHRHAMMQLGESLPQSGRVLLQLGRALLLVALTLAGWLAPVAAARADLPVHTLTFKADGTFEPARLEVHAGRFKIILVNESTEAVEFESLPLRKEKVLGPGVTSFVVLSLSRPGEYPFFDDFHPQARGTLVVLPKP